MTFPFPLQPFAHQLEVFDQTRDRPYFALLWEMGVGKTMPTIATAAHLAARGDIGALLVIAPLGPHFNWVTDELPRHWPTDLVPYEAFAYSSDRAETKRHQAALEYLMERAQKFPILTINYEALRSERLLSGHNRRIGGSLVPCVEGPLADFVRKKRAMLVFDESSRVKNPDGRTAKRALALARGVDYKRILEGTPVANGPFDAYQQFMLLDEDFWRRKGIAGFTPFKAEFGVFKRLEHVTVKNRDGSARRGRDGQPLRPEQCVGYKNLPVLHDMIKNVSSRLLKEDVLDLPPKLYQYASFEMTPRQRDVYEKLKKEFLVWLDENTLVTAIQGGVRLLRLAQVTSGYLPAGEGDEQELVPLGDTNPRLDLVEQICESIPHQAIFWCRFKPTVVAVVERLRKMGRSVARFDGDTSTADKQAGVEAFQRGDAQHIVGNLQSGLSRGYTLVRAKTVVYVENGFVLGDRLQSEDRAHRIGQEDPVLYLDVVARGTVDRQIVEALKEKFDVQAQITGDRLREWLR